MLWIITVYAVLVLNRWYIVSSVEKKNTVNLVDFSNQVKHSVRIMSLTFKQYSNFRGQWNVVLTGNSLEWSTNDDNVIEHQLLGSYNDICHGHAPHIRRGLMFYSFVYKRCKNKQNVHVFISIKRQMCDIQLFKS